MNDHSLLFKPGKIVTILSGPAGSTGKGTLAARLIDHNSGFVDIVANTFSTQASHTVVEDDGTTHVYKHLNSCAHLPEKYGKMYIGHGSAISVPVLLGEIKKYKMTPDKLGIDPLCVVIQTIDRGYEMGINGFDGEDMEVDMITSGTTASGVGAALARKITRRPNVIMTRDIPELEPFLCNVGEEIMDGLDTGKTMLAEVAQGYSLSMSAWFGDEPVYPHCTSRNSTPAQCLNDLNVALCYQGDVVLDYRTFPIRIHNNRYISTEDVVVESYTPALHKNPASFLYWKIEMGKKYHADHFRFVASENLIDASSFVNTTSDLRYDVIRPSGSNLYWSETNSELFADKYDIFEANSGPNYPDSDELSWDQLREDSGADVDLTQMTTLTKLPRRVATFSIMNMFDSVRHCQPPAPHKVWLSVNFVNWVDWDLCGSTNWDDIAGSSKFQEWDENNVAYARDLLQDTGIEVDVIMYGTGPKHSEYVSCL